MDLKKPNLAIISSYNELCGNASYTKALADGLREIYEVEVIALNTDLLRNKGTKKQSELHIESICNQIKNFDHVNIQFEAGLFGVQPKFILKRFKKIISNCKKLVITMHRYDAYEKKPGFKQLIKSLLKRKLSIFFGRLNWVQANNKYAFLYSAIIKVCKSNKIPIIVHTPRDSQLIRTIHQYKHVYDHPLCFFSQAKIAQIRKETNRNRFCQYFNLPEDKIYLGIFGFINEYKGHETAIKALKFLPDNYQLLIFGSQHPHSIKLEEKINPYIENLINLITDQKLISRVKFFGGLTDDQFIKALANCDYNILPYLEVNQGGSGIAALTLEAGSRGVFSQNKAFIELLKYAPDAFKIFSIGNYLELANAIMTYQDQYKDRLSEYHNKFNIHTSIQLHKDLFNLA